MAAPVSISRTVRTLAPVVTITSNRDRLIRENMAVVESVVAALLRRGQKSYIEKADLLSAGYAEMIRSVDRPSRPGAIPLAKRVARNVETTVLRFINKQIREYSYAQGGRAKLRRDADPAARGTLCPAGDPNDYEAAQVPGREFALGMGGDRDNQSSQVRALWRETESEVLYAKWLQWRLWFWRDIGIEVDRWRAKLADAPIGIRRFSCRPRNEPAWPDEREGESVAAKRAADKTFPYHSWLNGSRYTVCETWVRDDGKRVRYGTAFKRIEGCQADYMSTVTSCISTR